MLTHSMYTQGNKHDHHPTAVEEPVEHPVGFGKPGYSEGTPGQGPAGVRIEQLAKLHMQRILTTTYHRLEA